MSKEALEVAKRLAHVVWQTRYENSKHYIADKLEKNDIVSTDQPDNINFFFGQFDADNQFQFFVLVANLPESKIKDELTDFIIEYQEDAKRMLGKQEDKSA